MSSTVKKKTKKPSRPPSAALVAEVSPELFYACVLTFQAASNMTMPVVNPSEYKIGVGKAIYAFADRPETRGMFAVKKFLSADQAEFFTPIMSRIFCMGGLLGELPKQERFVHFFLTGEKGEPRVRDALIKAFAVAAFLPNTLDVDLESLHSEAVRFFAIDPS